MTFFKRGFSIFAPVIFKVQMTEIIIPRTVSCRAASKNVEDRMPPIPSINAWLEIEMAKKPSKAMAQPNSMPNIVRLENILITSPQIPMSTIFQIYRTCVSDDGIEQFSQWSKK
jgi:hypothetical protein